MKKEFLRLLLLFVLYFVSVTSIMAQSLEINIPGAAGGFESYFTSFLALVGVIPIVVEFIKKLIKVTEETPSILIQLISWLTGLVITIFGWYFELGFLKGLEIWEALIYGFGASLAANGVADTKIIQWIFSLFIKK